MRPFQMIRDDDVTGVSGTGLVAEGVVFDDGKTVIRWFGERRSTVVWDSLEDAIAIHGHNGATRMVFEPEGDRSWYRDSDSGQFVPKEYAEENPKTTEHETS